MDSDSRHSVFPKRFAVFTEVNYEHYVLEGHTGISLTSYVK